MCIPENPDIQDPEISRSRASLSGHLYVHAHRTFDVLFRIDIVLRTSTLNIVFYTLLNHDTVLVEVSYVLLYYIARYTYIHILYVKDGDKMETCL